MEPLSDRLAKLPPEKISLLMERLRARGAAAPLPAAAAIPRRAGDGPVPASFAQQRLWFVDRLEAGTWAYNVLSATRFDGDLDVGAMRRALDAVVERHEALRTVFAEREGAPVQVVVPGIRVPLEVEDLSALLPEEREAELGRRVNREPRRPFDLAGGPLLRSSLLRLAPDRHVLLLTLHHIVSDGWSRGILVREISALYAGFVRGEEPALPPLPVQYPDYAAWQREWLRGAELERQLGYWASKLRGAPPALELPADRPRPPVQSYEGGLHRFRISGVVAVALRRLARDEGATPFMVLLAAFKTLLLRLTGESDLVVGTPVANRGRVETEGVVGFFANTLALRTGLGGDPSFREALGRVRGTALEAYAHEELPFERLVEALRPPRDLSRSPVFQVMFLLDNTPVKTLRLPGVSLVPVQVDTGISSFDLTLMMEEKEDGLAAGLEYAAALFDPDTAARMADCWLSLLEGIAADPDRPLGSLPLLPAAERLRLAVKLNRTMADFPEIAPVHRMVEAQVRRTPDAPAVVSAAGTLTYAELQGRAAAVARALRARGAGPETRVGLLAGRSAEAVAGMLGILGAGAAYVPLDPEYPAERLRFMAGDAGVSLVLATREAAEAAGAGWDAPLLLLDDAAAGPPPGAGDEAPADVDMACAAYAIYTSGSTGTPKGVVVEHRSLAGYVAAARRSYGLAPGDRVLHSAPLGFDLSVEEVFPTLCAGAALVVRAPGAPGSADAFLDEAAAAGVTVVSFPTALWHDVTLRMEAGARLPASLRLAVLGGELAQPDRVAAWRAHAPAGVRLVNTYGPTEATVIATLHELSAADGGRVPIGAPVANATAHVLDAGGEPAPVGVPGELYVGGAGVARGYLGRPAETAARFVPDPFAAEPGARLYRTGDRVRRHRDGTLDFLGRSDGQLKLRGFRVEPGETEAALRADPRVERAAVLAREAPGGSRLVAYFTPAPGVEEAERPLAGALRAALAERLPAYMLPSAWVRVESWPLTPGGKTDVRALPDPADAAEPAALERVPTALEAVLSGAWAEALEVEWVPLERSLFELGAHSLLVTRVLGRMRGLFGVEVPVRALFLRPTVAAMAEELLRAAPDPAGVERTAALVLQVAELSDEQVRAVAASDPADGPPNAISR